MNPDNEKQPEELITDYFINNLSADELVQIEELLKTDSAFRDQFAEAGRDEWLLHHVHHMEDCEIIPLQPKASRRNSIRAIAAGITILATAGAIFGLKPRPAVDVAEIEPVIPAIGMVSDCFILDGEAISVVNNGSVRQLRKGDDLRSGDRISVPNGCLMKFQFVHEETFVTLEGGSQLNLLDEGQGKHIRLQSGELFADVAKQQEGYPMRIQTPDAEMIVLGTSFEIVADKITRLAVLSGAVRFNSKITGESTVVESGCIAVSEGDISISRPYKVAQFQPTKDETLGYSVGESIINVDPTRNASGFLQFDLSEVSGDILEATLRLRVMGQDAESGGGGDLRIFTVDPSTKKAWKSSEAAHFSGRVAANRNLELDLNPEMLSASDMAFLLGLDKGGNDIWFSSCKGEFPPVLELKIAVDEASELNVK